MENAENQERNMSAGVLITVQYRVVALNVDYFLKD